MTKSVMIVGVGGQGSLLASKLLGRLLMDEGFDVKVSEVHGMSQRGGSVVTYVRYGEQVFSPIISQGEADIIISFEKLEAARYAAFLKKDGKIIVNTQQIDPMPVIIGAAEYPENVLDELTDKGVSVEALDALSLAEEAGSSKAVNIVLMGKAAKYFGIPYEKWITAIENTVAQKFIEMNKKAFDLGYNS
ncbi:MAG: indolepyruvate oxidoreductase subunit beta [Acutalibacteraceae bacterium]|nr:indolepyruvate oxidoreductase subunit beta [Acutalibacteraceae bacterium]